MQVWCLVFQVLKLEFAVLSFTCFLTKVWFLFFKGLKLEFGVLYFNFIKLGVVFCP